MILDDTATENSESPKVRKYVSDLPAGHGVEVSRGREIADAPLPWNGAGQV
jgi:hypothetical protein